jgi:6-phosphogluconate dehydrogenase
VASLDSQFLSSLEKKRLEGARIFKEVGVGDIIAMKTLEKKQLVDNIKNSLYVSKIRNFVLEMNLILAKSIK